MSELNAIANPTPPARAIRERPAGELAVVHLVAEYWPYARTGGLAEAVRGIATFQAMSGTPVTVFMPLYRSVREAHPELQPVRDPYPVRVGSIVEQARIYAPVGPRTNPRVLFVDCPAFFDRGGIYGEGGADFPDNPVRFAFYCLAALHALPELLNIPVVVHAHDWHAALAPVYLRTKFARRHVYERMAAVLSVHNAGYQGLFGRDVFESLGLPEELFHWRYLEYYDQLNLLKGGLVFSDYVTTVSPTHAHELRTTGGGFGLHHTFIGLQDRFVGIRNGIDLDVWDPSADGELEATFSTEDLAGKAVCKRALQAACGLREAPRVPLFGMTARLVSQKGVDLLLGDDILPGSDAQFVFLGAGERHYEEALRAIAERYPERIHVDTDFAEAKEHRLLAGADLLLMPSLYEPCGLTQMRAQRYGALPVARRVGGLADTIEDQVTGFLFDEYTSADLQLGMNRATDLYRTDPQAWRAHMVDAMRRDFGWASSANRYLDVYRRALASHAPAR